MNGAGPTWRRDIADALRFFTRLPVPGDRRPSPDPSPQPWSFDRIAWAAPVAGAIVGGIGAVALWFAWKFGLPPLLAASLATAALVATTGALHEDGLADVADGFGGGATREQKLEIMRDSRIGAFGAVALMLSLIIRVGALAAALAHGVGFAAGALIAAAALSRAGALTPLALLDPARADGAGAAAGRLGGLAFASAWISALLIAFLLGVVATGVARALLALVASAIGAAAMAALAKHEIGGQTGDVAGAAQQWSEIAAWCGLLAGTSTP